MVHAHDKKSANEASSRTVTRVLVIFAVAVLGLLALAATQRTVVVSAKSSPTVVEARSERSNPRISVRSAAAAVTMNPAPFAPIAVDRTDDVPVAAACTAVPNDCSLRGAVAFANLNPGTTINVPAGTYQLSLPGGFVEGFNGTNAIGDLDVTGNNTSIIGAGSASTVIQQTQPNDRVLEINPFLLANFNFSISGVTLSGGKETTAVGGGGIIAGSINNTTSVTNCVISGNSATGAGTFGGGGIMVQGGSLTISGTTISSNSTITSGGGLSFTPGDPLGRRPSTGALAVSGSTFSSNTANSGASGGGAADLFNFNGSISTYDINSSTFSNNRAAAGSGGAIIVESGPLTLTTSSLSGNTAANRGGAIFSGSSVVVTFSRLVGNSVPIAANGLSLYSATPGASADDNWWGINTGPSPNDFRNAGGPVLPMTFLTLRMSASPNEICSGENSTLTADIKERNDSSLLTSELNGLPAFPAIFNNPILGTISGGTPFVDGVATATFTAGPASGMGSADVTADNQTVTATISISTATTTDPGDQSVCEGGTATFSTTASGPGTITFVWKKGATVLNNGDLGGRVTITSGGSSSSLSISNAQPGDADTYTVEATGSCNTATQTATLTVNAATTATDPADQTVCEGDTASFATTATGTNVHYAWTLDGSPFNGDSPSINVGALPVGSHSIGLTVTGECGTVTHSATLVVRANTVASDPADVTLCQGGTANFSTTASGSNLQYAWTVDNSPYGNGPSISVPTGSLSVGSHTVGLTVTGDCGVVTQTATLTVQSQTATTDPPDQSVCKGTSATFSTTASGTGPFSYAWTLDGSPFNGNSPSITIPTGSLSAGSHTVTVTTSGSCGTATQTAILNVTNPTPVITLSSTSASVWPPNHQYQTFNVTDFVSSATGGCDSNTNLTGSVVIQSVSSDEPEDNPSGGDGNTLNDIVIAPDCKTVQLRRERDGNGNGRVYTITFKVADSFGNTTTATVKVSVPVSNNGTATDNGAAAGYTVLSACP